MKHMNYQVACFGEILFDILDNVSKPGGAPLNVAYHLKQVGLDSFLISSAGNDKHGKDLVNILETWGLTANGIAISDTYKTGEAIVKKGAHGLPKYELVYPAAWDNIPWREEYGEIISNADAFVFGSLSSRNNCSYQTLLTCLTYSRLNVFDINLRPPHFTRTVLEDLLQKTHILKVNDAELIMLNEWYGDESYNEKKQITNLREQFDIGEIMVTKGADGASYYSNEHELHLDAINIKVADTVGSGDAFLAGFLSKRLNKLYTIEECLMEGIRKGAFVASQYGACPPY